MRLRLVLALLFLVALVSASRPARRNGAQRSGSRGTSCKGSSGGRGCRPRTTPQTTQSRPTSISNSSTRRPSTRLPTKRTTTQSTTSKITASSSTKRPRIPTKRPPNKTNKQNQQAKPTKFPTQRTTSKITASSSTRRPSTRLPTKRTTTRRFPTKRPPNSASTVDEESISDSSTKNKTSAKKYFQNLKTRFQTAAIWFVENKDKSLDEILVERWKEKCSGTDSKKEKRKRCVSAALAEREDDTAEEKVVKDALKNLLEEDSDEVYEFLSRSSSRTFRDIENDGETHDLGAATDKDCQAQEGNRRTKRCVTWVRKDFVPHLDVPSTVTADVTENFSKRHVMTDKGFEEFYRRQDLTQSEVDTFLQIFRKNRGGGNAHRNTIIKVDDLKEQLLGNSDWEETGRWNGHTWEKSWRGRTNTQIPFIQVENGAVTKGTAHIEFSTDGYGNINHMVGPIAPGA